MQVCNNITHPLSQNSQLHKTLSMPNFQDQLPFHSQLQSIEETYWRQCTKWILKLRKKINISKSSLYLAVSYLAKLTRLGFTLTHDNHQKVGAGLVLISAKMNEIYPPKMSSLLNRCSNPVSKHELTMIESWILSYFNFDMSFSEISFSYLAKILGPMNQDKMQDSEKLLGLAVT